MFDLRRVLILALVPLLCAGPLSSGASAAAKDKAPAKSAAPGSAQPPAQPPATPKGERIDDAEQYAHCLALARQKPQEGWEEALAWTSLGGGEPARHCGAIALVGIGEFEEAANRLEQIASTSHRDVRLRAGMLAQAGQAWLLARNPERAYAAQTAALKLVPGAPDLLVDRAQSLAERKNYKEALADLDQALANAPNRVDALTFRATAKRYLDDLPGAAADLAKALRADPQYQDAWLEDGMVKRLTGDEAGARQSWMKVLEVAPNSVAADTARRNIELLDLKTR